MAGVIGDHCDSELVSRSSSPVFSQTLFTICSPVNVYFRKNYRRLYRLNLRNKYMSMFARLPSVFLPNGLSKYCELIEKFAIYFTNGSFSARHLFRMLCTAAFSQTCMGTSCGKLRTGARLISNTLMSGGEVASELPIKLKQRDWA